MNRPMQTLVTIAVVGLALWIARCSGEQAGRTAARLDAEVRQTDSSARATEVLRGRVAYSESVAVARTRELTHARGEISRLRNRVVRIDSLPHWGDSLPPFVIEQLAARDSLIGLQEQQLAAQDSALTLWQAVAAAKDTVIERLTAERLAYRNLAAAFQRRAEPGIFEQARRSLPWAVAAVVVWEIAR